MSRAQSPARGLPLAPAGAGGFAPLAPEEFAALIDHLGPFERCPDIAVGVSGGPDSLALALLLGDWAASRGGRVLALTVDHGLRPESAVEAGRVAAWLAGRPRIEHHILRWDGAKPATGIQAKAREARHRLMTDWCRTQGARHLALAHHLGDQIETHLMRAAHGSGARGLAGMSALREMEGIRLLRPLLRVPKGRLIASLRQRRQDWIDDPSNRDRRFERVRLREASAGLDVAALDDRLERLGRRRAAEEVAAKALLADTVRIDPAGFALLAPEAWRDADMPVVEAAFGRLLRAIGTKAYAPGSARLAGILDWLRNPASSVGRRRGWTLAGCAVTRRRGMIVVARDWGDIRDRPAIAPGETLIWDRRFRVSCTGVDTDRPRGGLTVEPLGEAGLGWLGQSGLASLDGHEMPESARKALPALWNGSKLLAVPHLGVGAALDAVFLFDPEATSCGFTVAYATTHTMYGQEM